MWMNYILWMKWNCRWYFPKWLSCIVQLSTGQIQSWTFSSYIRNNCIVFWVPSKICWGHLHVGDLMIGQAPIIFCSLTAGGSNTQIKTSYNAGHGNFCLFCLLPSFLSRVFLKVRCIPLVELLLWFSSQTICIFIKKQLWPLLNCQGLGMKVNIVTLWEKKKLFKEFFKRSKNKAGYKWKATINNTLTCWLGL
jgi:hypothetical protein